MTRPLRPLLGLAFLSLALSACSSGQTGVPAVASPVSGTGYTGALDGTISVLSSSFTGFTVSGQSVNLGLSALDLPPAATSTSAGPVWVNGEPSSRDALAAGQQVHVEVKDGVATSVDVSIEVRGHVDAADVSGGTLTVAGQTVAVSASTRISLGDGEAFKDQPAHTLAEVAALTDAVVEVTGSRDASGVIQATRLEVRTAQQRQRLGLNDAEVAGKVTALDPAARTFVVSGVTVSYGSATVQGATLAVGAGVEVRGHYDDAAQLLTAVRVGVHAGGRDHDQVTPPPGARIQVEGQVTALDPAASTLTVGGFTADLHAASVTGTLAVGVEIHLSGTVDATTPTLIHATAVQAGAFEERRFEGLVSNLSGATFDLGTLHVDGSKATQLGTLANGLPAVVFGHFTDAARTTLLASSVLGPQTRTLTGKVRDLNTTTGSFRMGEWRINYAAAKITGALSTATAVTVTGTPGPEVAGVHTFAAATVTVR